MRKHPKKCFFAHRVVSRQLAVGNWQKSLKGSGHFANCKLQTANFFLLTLLFNCLLTIQTRAVSQNTGFENSTTDWQFTGSGTFSVNTNSLYYRTGVQSLKLNTSSTSDSKAYDANY